LIAARWGIGREAMDAFALESHQRAIAAEDRGASVRAIAPVEITMPDGARSIERDEGPRRETSLEKLGVLRPSFEDAAMAARFPEIRWSVTAGNASQVTDGASAKNPLRPALASSPGRRSRTSRLPATIRS
jgi:acetyl-CoA acetyltransferase